MNGQSDDGSVDISGIGTSKFNDLNVSPNDDSWWHTVQPDVKSCRRL